MRSRRVRVNAHILQTISAFPPDLLPGAVPVSLYHRLFSRADELFCGTGGPSWQLQLPFEESREPLRAFWQTRFYDFNVYSEGKIKEKLHYMQANPVIRKPVKHPGDLRWSSWSFYYGRPDNLIQIDKET